MRPFLTSGFRSSDSLSTLHLNYSRPNIGESVGGTETQHTPALSGHRVNRVHTVRLVGDENRVHEHVRRQRARALPGAGDRVVVARVQSRRDGERGVCAVRSRWHLVIGKVVGFFLYRQTYLKCSSPILSFQVFFYFKKKKTCVRSAHLCVESVNVNVVCCFSSVVHSGVNK